MRAVVLFAGVTLSPAAPAAAGNLQQGVDWLQSRIEADGRIGGASIATPAQAATESLETLSTLGSGNARLAAAVLAGEEQSTEQMARRAVALAAAGNPVGALVDSISARRNADGGFGSAAGYGSAVIDSAFAITALAAAGRAQDALAHDAVVFLAGRQQADGRWTDAAATSDIYTTALALRAVWLHRRHHDVTETLARGRDFLLGARDAGGRWPETFESAQSLIALMPLLIDRSAIAGSVDALAAVQASDGGFEADAYATALALRALSLLAQRAPDEITVAGRVIDADTRLPLAGVAVALTGASAVTVLTSAEGRFELRNLAAGAYTVAFSRDLYATATSQFQATTGTAFQFGDVALLKSTSAAASTTGTVRGTITATSGEVLGGVLVTASGGLSATTAADGSYLIANVTAGSVSLTASLESYRPVSASGNLPRGGFLVFSPQLAPGDAGAPVSTGVIEGVVLNGQTELPLNGATVSLTGSTSASQITGATGTYRFEIQPGDVTITVSASGYQSVTRALSVAANTILEYSPALYPSGQPVPTGANATTVTGLVVDSATDAPIAGAAVYLRLGRQQPHEYWRVRVTAGQQASFTISEVEFRGSVGGADLATGGTAIASSGTASRAFDNSSSTLWNPSTPYPQWIGYRFATPVRVAEYEIRAGTVALPQYPKDWTLEYSDNGTSWTIADTRTGQAFDPSVSKFYIVGTRYLTGTDGRFQIPGVTASEVEVEVVQGGYRSAQLAAPVPLAEQADLGEIRMRPLSLDRVVPDLTVPLVSVVNTVTDPDSLLISGSVAATVKNVGTDALAVPVEAIAFIDTDFDLEFDDAIDTVLGRAMLDFPLAANGSGVVQIDVSGPVAFRDPPIAVVVNHDGAAVERRLTNNVGISGSECLRSEPAIGTLQPKLKWHWKGAPQNPTFNAVLAGVAVAQLTDDNGDGQINTSDIPDIIFPGFTGTDGGRLTAIRGDSGANLWQAAIPVAPFGSPAVGDIDGDGLVEIAIPNHEGDELLVFEHDGTLKWSAVTTPTIAENRDAVAIADVNRDGSPDIVHGARVFRANGTQLWNGIRDRGTNDGYATASIVADVDLDGFNNVVAGRTLYDAGGRVLWHYAAALRDGFNAVGNFDADDYAEIVLVSTGNVYLLQHDGQRKWGPVAIDGGGRGGPPTIADIDGDGVPEIGVAGAHKFVVLNADGSTKWKRDIQDISSSSTGSSVFDMDGDGRAEVFYADEKALRIYDGTTGATLFEILNASSTVLELPVIADIDNDGHAELLLGGNQNAASRGLRAFEGINDDWLPTRKIWNQHSYHITNVNDDGTIPRHEQASWTTHNSYRLNDDPEHDALETADLSVSLLRLLDHGASNPLSLLVRVGNGGAQPSPAGLKLAIYDGDPASGGVLVRTVTIPALAVGRFEDLRLDNLALSGLNDIHTFVDSALGLAECNESNNRAATPYAAYVQLGQIGVATDQPSYAPATPVLLSAISTNLGRVAGDYAEELLIEDAAGALVARFPVTSPRSLGAAASREQVFDWNTAQYLAGSYSLHGILRDASGAFIAEARSPFTILPGPDVAPVVGLRVASDRARYHTTDRVRLDSLVSNLTDNAPQFDVELRLTVRGPAGESMFARSLAIPEIAPAEQQPRADALALQDASEGAYLLSGQIVDGDGRLLASHAVQFLVTEDRSVSLAGEVTVQTALLERGDPQSCTDRLRNTGTAAIDAQAIRRLLTRLDGDGGVIQAEETLATIAPGGSLELDRAIATEGLAAPADYACVLQARIGSEWRTLDHDSFRLAEEPQIRNGVTTDRPVYAATAEVRIDLSVENFALQRIERDATLRLQAFAPSGEAILSRDFALEDLEPQASTVRTAGHSLRDAPEGAYAVSAEVLGHDGARLALAQTQFEVRLAISQALSGTVEVAQATVRQGELQTCIDRVANRSIFPIAGVPIRQSLRQASTGAVSGELVSTMDLPALGSGSLTRAFGTEALALGTHECRLEVKLAGSWQLLAFAAFVVEPPPIRVDLELDVGAHGRVLVLIDTPNPGNTAAEPVAARQRAFLADALTRLGWSFTIVTSKDAFARELRSGTYDTYALFSEGTKLDEQVQKELREAVYRGDGLLEAGAHDQRHHAFDAALGLKYLGKHSAAGGVETLDGSVIAAGYSDLRLPDKALRADLAGAQRLGRFLGNAIDAGTDTAVAAYDYGQGRSVYVGYDLLAEATALRTINSLHAQLIVRALEHVSPSLAGGYRTGQVLPLRISLTNRGIATPGRVILSLPAGSQVVDAGDGIVMDDGTLVFDFALAEEATMALGFELRLPDAPGIVEVSALLQSGMDPDFTDLETRVLRLDVQAVPGLAEARAAAAADAAFRQAQHWLDTAQEQLALNRPAAALAALIKATDALQTLSQPAAAAIRLMVDKAIFDVARRL